MAAITTLDFPAGLPVVRKGEHWYARADERTLRLSNLDKVFWPSEGYTKGDLLTYYFNISPIMLPHLVQRPLTLKRMPNGVKGDFFYEGKTINYLSVNDVVGMLWIANLGCIEFHPLHARAHDQAHPTYAFFDLDPFEPATWDDVTHVAGLIKVVLDQLSVTAYPKTSGATGMQIMVPLDGTLTYSDVRRFIGGVAELVHAADPETTTLEWDIPKRAGKVFLDVNMNREGANIAAAYSVRPEPGATVSTPFTWEELGDVRPELYTIGTVFERVMSREDPFLPVAEGPGQSLTEQLELLEGQLPKKKGKKR